MERITVFLTILLSLLSRIQAQDPPFTVTRPDPGDTLVLSSYSGSNEIYIEWTVAPGTEDEPVLITLQRGENVANLETIETVNGTAPNNGSYTWDGIDSISLESGTDPWLARTACNYTVRLSVAGSVAYSQYFTIINEDDGPIPDSATCPIERGIARPQFADGDAGGTVSSGEGTAGGESGETASNDRGTDGGIATFTLAVGVAIPIVVLLILFGLVLWLGIGRGWFVKLTERHAPVTAEKQERPIDPYGGPPRELHSDHRAWEAEGRAVHQLEGDERIARSGNGPMRGS